MTCRCRCREEGKDPVCGDGRSTRPRRWGRASTRGGGLVDLLFLLGVVQAEIRPRPGAFVRRAVRSHARRITRRDGSLYTCPMHPEIVRDRPGTCPICGMALEPMTATGADDANPELDDMTRRFWVCLVLTAPLLLLAMAEMILGHSRSRGLSAGRSLVGSSSRWRRRWSSGAGWPFFDRGWASVVNRSLNMFTLIALGTGAAYALQRRGDALPRPLPGLVPRPRRRGPGLLRGGGGHHDAGAAGPGAGAARRSQTSSAIKALLGLAPKTARRLRDDGSEEDVPLDQVRVGDGSASGRARRCPVDGVVARRQRARSTSRWSPASRSRSRKTPGRPAHRRHGQRHRRPRDAGRAGGHRHDARPDRADGRRGPAHPGPDPAAGRRRLRATSCPPSCCVAVAHVRRLGRLRARSRGWPTRWSTPSRS